MFFKKHYPTIIFLLLLTGLSLIYNYHEISFKRPQSVHKWRQSDCASIALNYYQQDMDFFDPEVHNLTSDGGITGKCYTSEIPILYYTVASFYKLFGYHEYIFRIFNMLLFFLGLFHLFKLFQYVLKDDFWAISLSLLFFTSPVLVYYGNNFLSNSSALAFSMIGWYYFVRFYSEGKQKWFYVSMFVFFMAAAFKITGLFSLFAIAGIYGLEILGLIRFKEKQKLFDHPIKQLLSIIAVFFLIGIWIIKAHLYNQSHACTYFSTTFFPLWNLDKSDILMTLDKIYEIWLDHYFHLSVLALIFISFLFNLFYFKKNKKLFIYSILFISAEALFFIVLQFWTFGDHDYYTIGMYILPVLILISTFDILKRHYSHIFNAKIVKTIFAIFLFFNAFHTNQKMNARYNGWMNDYEENKDIYSITPYLRQIGITQNDTIISLPDGSHVSLYLMNQKGWTNYSDAQFNRGEKIPYNQDSITFQKSIDNGAAYFVLNGLNVLVDKPYLQHFCTNLIGNYNNVYIFDLKNRNGDFDVNNRSENQHLFCDAENLSADGLHFIGMDSVHYKDGLTRSEHFAHSGKYASKLYDKSPYGMTITLDNLIIGERVEVTAWRKTSGNAKGEIVVSSNQSDQKRILGRKILETDIDGWEKIGVDFYISNEMQGKEWGVFVYNPEKEPVYFDDLEIVRYRSVFSNNIN